MTQFDSRIWHSSFKLIWIWWDLVGEGLTLKSNNHCDITYEWSKFIVILCEYLPIVVVNLLVVVVVTTVALAVVVVAI